MRRLLPLLIILSPLSSLLSPSVAVASDYQQCTSSSNCTIGEFLYNDDYSPLTGASCTLTAKYPDNTSYLNAVAMTGGADGWYSYTAAVGTTEGLYHSNICCTPAGGTLCIDKTFEVKSASGSSLTPAAIWGYSDRTLTGYGTLVSDIWNYSGRTLTSFGSLVSDVWSYSGRTMTGFGDLVDNIWGAAPATTIADTTSPTSLSGILAEQKTQRELLEKLVNAPIVSLSLGDGGNIPDLESKLDESKKQASVLYDNLSSAKSRLMALDSKWDRLSADAVTKEISSVASLFQNSDALAGITKSWDNKTVTGLQTGVKDVTDNLASLLTSVSLTKPKQSPLALSDTLSSVSNLESVLGDTTSSSDDDTFFGYLESVSERNQTLSSEKQKIAAVLENLSGQGVNSTEKEVQAIKSRLLTLNQYPGGESLASPAKVSSDAKLNFKNILYSLQALIGLNTQLLAMNAGDPVRSLWLEEGSIIFRAVITNPSSVITQTVPLKFYLPREIKTEDIIQLDPSLGTTYDPSEEALYASGSYDLAPKQTKVIYVEVEDIWHLDDSEIQTLRTQAKDLLKPLEKTAYFSQGTTLKSDIDVTLDKVLLSTGKAVTPENRIRTYREAKLELTKVSANMNRLEDLVAQSSGTGSVFGFVGGVQTTAVWGIILVIISGFVFLSIYFKKLGLTQSRSSDLSAIRSETEERSELLQPAPMPRLSPLSLESKPAPSWRMPAIITAVVVVTALSTITLTRLSGPKAPTVIDQVTVSPSPIPSPTPATSTEPESQPTPKPVPDSIEVKSEKSVLGESDRTMATIQVPEDSSVNVRNKPSSDADIIMAIKESVDIVIFKVDGDWRQIGFTESDSTKGYWVNVKFISPSN